MSSPTPPKLLDWVRIAIRQRRYSYRTEEFHVLHIPVGDFTIQRPFRSAVTAAGITKHATCHTLRHAFASHLLESN